ncbi:MAG TPA: class I SAM-dependent methyltransferase [Chloroflexia bacterium]|nr:class I SAM-dependent methyltransferase [Chloroflexia bacterium]
MDGPGTKYNRAVNKMVQGSDTNQYIESNRKLWDRWTELHEHSEMYDLANFKPDGSRLGRVEREEVGDVIGRSLLHLQCHFGLDTLSLAGLGASATGVDFSGKAITLARSLSTRLGVPATFVLSDVYDLPGNLRGQFDIVFTSHGVLWWLPDLARWARVVAHFLKPGGTFVVVDSHPFASVFDNDHPSDLVVKHGYFSSPEPQRFEVQGSYAAADPGPPAVEYGWTHSMSEIVSSIITAGLHIESLREFPFQSWRMFPFMEQRDDGCWRLPSGMPDMPLMFSLKATKLA